MPLPTRFGQTLLKLPTVFISHTTRDPRDSVLAHLLARGLKERGSRVFIAPEAIPAGAEWEPRLVQSVMKECTHFLVLLSAASISAEWVLKEIGLARSRYEATRDLEILPLFLGTVGEYPGSDFIARLQKVPYKAEPHAQLEAVCAALGLRARERNRTTPVFEGRRFWIPRGQVLQLSFDGFLPDPESDDWKDWNPQLVSFESISQIPCLALLGEPGTGKSTALESIRAGTAGREEARHLFVDLKKCTSERLLDKYLFEAAEFKEWRFSTDVLDLFLDSLDECLIHIDTVARMLVTELESCPRERLRLRIACRTAEWPELLSKELSKLWGEEGYRAYELAPLRRIDVAEAARIHGLQPEVFLEAVQKRAAVPLAIKPMTLQLLISAFKKDGWLPSTQHGLYEQGCLRLCEDPSADRAASRSNGAWIPEDRLLLAERIAAVTLFCKRTSLYLGNAPTSAPEGGATLADLSYGSERVRGREIPVEPEHIRETLQTGLFTGGAGEGLVGWSHWTFAEFLAARYLASRVTLERIKEFLLRPGENGTFRVIPPLQETAAWLTGMRPEFLAELIPLDPQVLLRSSVAISDAGLRARLVESLLKLLDAGRLVSFWLDLRRRGDVLKHPALAAQVLPYITDRTKSFYARWAAIEITEACGESSIADELVRVALDESERLELRRACVMAIGVVGGHQAREGLRPILETQEDPEKELVTEVLRVLWPEHLSAEQLFENLTLPGDTNHFGSYHGFLSREVVEHLKPEDLPRALQWVKGHGLSLYFRRLAEGILRSAWTHLDAPGVLQGFVRVISDRLRTYVSVFTGDHLRDEADMSLQAEPAKRRGLVQALVPHLGPEGSWLLSRYSLVSGDDLPWLLEQLEQGIESGMAERWLELIARVFNLSRPDHIESVWNAKERVPSLARQFAKYFDPVPIDSPEAARMREEEEEFLRWRRRSNPELPPIEQRVRHWLDRFEAGELGAWYDLGLDLSEELRSSLASLPDWLSLDEPLRARCVAAAERYLQDAEPGTAEWLGSDMFHPLTAAGYRALRLVWEQRPEVLEGWSSEQWARWAPLVLDWTWEQEEKDRALQVELVTLAYSKAPDAMVSALMTWLEKATAHRSVHSILQRLAKCWDSRLEKALLERVRTDTGLSTEDLGALLDALVPRSPEAVEFALWLVTRPGDDDSTRKRKLKVSRVLLNRALRDAWPVLWPMIQSDPAFGEELLEGSMLYRMQRDEIAAALQEDSIAELYLWLVRRFPEEGRSKTSIHGFQLTYLQNSLLSALRERGSRAAVSALRRLSEALPDRDGLKASVLHADEQRLREEWQGLTPAELFK